jgi:hypothetical protein
VRARAGVTLVVLGLVAWGAGAAPAPLPRAGKSHEEPVRFEVDYGDWAGSAVPRGSPDGRLAVRVAGPLGARVVEAGSGRAVGPVLRHRGGRPGMRITTWAFSPDGRRLAIAFGEAADPEDTAGGVHVWEVATGKFLGAPGEDLGWVEAVSFSPDGRAVRIRCLEVSGK